MEEIERKMPHFRSESARNACAQESHEIGRISLGKPSDGEDGERGEKRRKGAGKGGMEAEKQLKKSTEK